MVLFPKEKVPYSTWYFFLLVLFPSIRLDVYLYTCKPVDLYTCIPLYLCTWIPAGGVWPVPGPKPWRGKVKPWCSVMTAQLCCSRWPQAWPPGRNPPLSSSQTSTISQDRDRDTESTARTTRDRQNCWTHGQEILPKSNRYLTQIQRNKTQIQRYWNNRKLDKSMVWSWKPWD